MSNHRRILAAAFFSFAVVLIFVPIARAEQPIPTIIIDFQLETESGPAIAGHELLIGAYLVDPAGNPIRGQIVTFSREAKFMNVSGRVEIGQANTNEFGRASVGMIPRSTGVNMIKAQFEGNDVFAPIAATRSLEVSGSTQLHVEPSPMRIPGANAWMVVAVLATIWSVYLGVAGAGLLIALRQDEDKTGAET